MAGFLGLSGNPEIVEAFKRWGYPDWFRVVVGAAEIFGAVLLLIPRSGLVAAAGLGLIMAGAVGTHLVNHEALRALLPAALLLLLVLAGWLRPRRVRS